MHKGKNPKGMVIMIAVGGGKPPRHGQSHKDKNGCEMIKLPIEALASEDEAGKSITPEVGDTVALDVVEGEVSAVNDDGTIHVELKTAGGQPVEYVEHSSEEREKKEADSDKAMADELDAQGDELRAAAEEEDEKIGY